MTLTKEQLMPAIATAYLKQLSFIDADGTVLLDRHSDSLVLYNKEGKTTGTLDKIWEKVKNLNPICPSCWNKGLPASHVMVDGHIFCDACYATFKPYYHCRVCNTPLRPEVATYAQREIQRQLCGSDECQRRDDIQRGKLCCDQAEYTNCVCTRSYKCPVHGETHVGTHD